MPITTMDFVAGARIDISDNADVTLRLVLTNIWNQRVITDARAMTITVGHQQTRSMKWENSTLRATVFVGPPRMVRQSAVLD